MGQEKNPTQYKSQGTDKNQEPQTRQTRSQGRAEGHGGACRTILLVWTKGKGHQDILRTKDPAEDEGMQNQSDAAGPEELCRTRGSEDQGNIDWSKEKGRAGGAVPVQCSQRGGE